MNRCSNCEAAFRPTAPEEPHCPLCRRMRNKVMARKVSRGEAVDLSEFSRTVEGDYILAVFEDGVDYCDTRTEEWIWSVGAENGTRRILASTSTKFYQNPNFQCLWLR